MLSIIYWEGKFPVRYQLGLNIATVLRSMIGQVVFGLLADRYGRRKMYGLELIVTITASLGLATASSGVNNSMSIIGLLIFWRLVMGVGIGAVCALTILPSPFVPYSVSKGLTQMHLVTLWISLNCTNAKSRMLQRTAPLVLLLLLSEYILPSSQALADIADLHQPNIGPVCWLWYSSASL